MEKAAIFGAAGAIGPWIAAELQRRKIPFRAVGRSRAKLQGAYGTMPLAELFDADLNDLRSAGAAARGVDAIFYCVGLPYPSHHLHPVMMRTTLEAAAVMKVERLVLISSVYPYGVPRTARVSENHPREPESRKGQYRKEQEDLVLEAHRAGRVRGLIVRLPDFYGPGATLGFANLVFEGALADKTANWIGPVNTAHEFIYVPDSGPVIVELASRDDCYGEAWNLAGPEPINTLDFITRVYRAAGLSPKDRTAGRTLLKLLGVFNPLMRELPEILYLQETPVLLDDSKLIAKLGSVNKTSYDDGIRQTLAWLRSSVK
jgi:nucleoside-diphosphate-sugar epimerase